MNLTFLNAAFLFGAFAALLPLVIHLFSRRRVETVDFSSLRFLRELERRKIRRVRIRQILLLVVRSLIILCAALALARPTLSGALAAGSGHARTSVAVVVDQSASVSRAGANGGLFDEVKAAAARIVELLDEGDQAFLVTAASPPTSVLDGGTFSRGTLAGALAELPATGGATDYSGAVRLAAELLRDSRNLNRELYVVGDMQRTGWAGAVRRGEAEGHASGAVDGIGADSADGSAGGGSEGGGDEAAPTIYLFELEGPLGNVSVHDATARRTYGAAAGRFSVTARVENGGRRTTETPARLFVDGVQVGRAGVELGPGESGTVRFSVSVEEGSWHSGRVELPDDALDIDNRAYFVIPPACTTEVLIVEPDARSEREDGYFAARALDPSGASDRFRPSVVPLSALAAQEQGRFPAVVLADVGRVDDAAAEWLRRHVEGGGGVLYVLGDRTDVRAWNEGRAPGAGSVRLVEPFERPSPVRLAPAVHGHPLLEGLAVGERLIDEIGVRRGFVAGVSGGDEVLDLPGLGPALVLTRGGVADAAGEVAVLLTALDTRWTDLPRSGFLVPLLHRVIAQISGGAVGRSEALVGEDLEFPLPDGAAGRVEVLLPDGTTVTPEHGPGARSSVVLSNAAQPGIHVFSMGGRTVGVGAVNVDPTESKLEPATRSQVAAFLEGFEHRYVDAAGDVGAAILEARRGRELWRVLVYAAVALLAFEMYLARVRSG